MASPTGWCVPKAGAARRLPLAATLVAVRVLVGAGARSSARVVRSDLGGPTPVPQVVAGVTGRERGILAMIASGQSNKRIAQALQRSVKTVEKHRAT